MRMLEDWEWVLKQKEKRGHGRRKGGFAGFVRTWRRRKGEEEGRRVRRIGVRAID